MPPKKISILGVGLLGGSIGLAAKSVIKDCEIIGYGHRSVTLEAAIERGAIDLALMEPERAVEGCDLVIVCTPVGIIGSVLSRIAPALAPGAVVTDVGSTKRTVVEAGEKAIGGRFVGSHPIAGSEKRGVEFADAGLFRGALCLTTPTERTEGEGLESVEEFWRLIGMKVRRISAEDHDRLLGEVSHLPHAVAAALVAVQDDAGLELAGKGFLDLTRIAGGDGELWRDIFLDNRDNLKAGIGDVRAELEWLEDLLDKGDAEGVRKWLAGAAERRKVLEARRKGDGVTG